MAGLIAAPVSVVDTRARVGEAPRGTFHSFRTGHSVSVFTFLLKHGGARDFAEASQQAAVATYERAIQVAFREVADALAQRGTVEDTEDAVEEPAGGREQAVEGAGQRAEDRSLGGVDVRAARQDVGDAGQVAEQPGQGAEDPGSGGQQATETEDAMRDAAPPQRVEASTGMR